MNNLGFFWAGNWSGVLSTILIILCFYFTLTFFQHLREEDKRAIKQSKIAATICLALALLIPVFFNMYVMNQMMN